MLNNIAQGILSLLKIDTAPKTQENAFNTNDNNVSILSPMPNNSGIDKIITNDDETKIINYINNENDTDVQKTECSAGLYIPGISDIIGGIADLIDGDSKDGKIGNTKQIGTGDCALISSITALSYTQEGAKIIEDALEYNDGYTTVHLSGIGDYEVHDRDVNLTKASMQYTSGDDDMIILELALEQAIDDLVSGRAVLSEDAPWELQRLLEHNETTTFNSSLEGTFPNALYYLLTGKTGDYAPHGYEDKMNEMLDKFMNNGLKDYSMTAVSSFENNESKRKGIDGYNRIKLTDVNTGKNVELIDTHGYSVKNF
ncbi:hypothetical protein IJ531_02245, partial [bacterium]|nr:hypothetical protein [bacterium]